MPRRHPALVPLSHDHRRALALAFRLHNPSPPGPATATTPPSTPLSRRAETLAAWDHELVLHFAIEEENVFPAIRAATEADVGTHRLLDRLVADHRRLEEIRTVIAGAEGATLEESLRAFADLLERHVRVEERELFAEFPGAMPLAEVERIQAIVHLRRPPDPPRT